MQLNKCCDIIGLDKKDFIFQGVFVMRANKMILLISCVLAMLMLLCACTPATPGSESSADQPAQSGTSSDGDVSEGGFPYADHEPFNTTVTIYTVATSRHPYGELQFVPNDESSYGQVSSAVANRNNIIEEKYGIKIQVVAEPYPTDNLALLIEGGSCDYDLVCDSVDRMVGKVTENLFYAIDDYVDLTNPWWDDDAIDAITLSDGHYFVAGDALITDDDNTYLTLYNKSLYNENQDVVAKYGDIYQLVRERKFTLDAFNEISRMVSTTDSAGQWSTEATYGNLSHSYGATIMFNGSGEALAKKTADGGVEVNIVNRRAVDVFEKVYNLMSNQQVTTRAELLIGKIPEAKSTYGFAELEYMFVNGRGLFYNTTSSSISLLKTSTAQRSFEFGVLPIPNYEEGDDYHCAVNRYQSSVIGIPTSCKQIEAAAFLLEALGYYSDDVTNAYYSLTLQLQALDDDADAEMLDLVYNSRFYDLGAIYTWGTSPALAGLQGSVIGNPNTNELSSRYDAIKDSVEQGISDTLELYESINK